MFFPASINLSLIMYNLDHLLLEVIHKGQWLNWLRLEIWTGTYRGGAKKTSRIWKWGQNMLITVVTRWQVNKHTSCGEKVWGSMSMKDGEAILSNNFAINAIFDSSSPGMGNIQEAAFFFFGGFIVKYLQFKTFYTVILQQCFTSMFLCWLRTHYSTENTYTEFSPNLHMVTLPTS